MEFRNVRRQLLCGGLLLALTTPLLAGGVAIVETALLDNGDADAFADTNETVNLTLRIENSSGAALTGVTATLTTKTPQLICITGDTIAIGSMAVGETRWTSGSFQFHVQPGADRALLGLDEFDDLSADLRVLIHSENFVAPALDSHVVLDLDLDVISTGSGSTTFFESFEGTLGAFEIENLDSGLSSPAASDGYRCQYNDPAGPNPNLPDPGDCFLGVTPAHADVEWWGLSGPAFSPMGGRGFSGFHSLFFGEDLGPPNNWTTPTGHLEAVRTIDPIKLSFTSPPLLSFKQQASLADDRVLNSPPGETADRGVVLVQLADAAGNPGGDWIKIYPYKNVYDTQATDGFTNCMFDPIDDGSTEDMYFDPSDPNRNTGPSSTCYPEYVFTNLGESSSPFDPANLGNADGPALAGTWGIGTWVESRFDLSRFRGRSVRLRFLTTSIKTSEETWQELYNWNPLSGDDGWWIDDVSIDQALTTAAVFALDNNDNSSLPAPPGTDSDSDGVADVCDNCLNVANLNQFDDDIDGHGDSCDVCVDDPANPDVDVDLVCDDVDNCPTLANPGQSDNDLDAFGTVCDCDDANAATYPGAFEINDGLDNNCPGDAGYGLTDETSGNSGFLGGDTVTYSWTAQQGTSRYQVVRGNLADYSGSCDVYISVTPVHVDATVPPPGGVFFYVNRPFQPNKGSFGAGAAGERAIPCAP